jgi:DNA-binding GntR family transcriptional regulator
MRMVRNRAMVERDRVQRSVVDHIGIIEAIESRDPDVAERLVREHTMSLHGHMRRTWARLARPMPKDNAMSVLAPAQ